MRAELSFTNATDPARGAGASRISESQTQRCMAVRRVSVVNIQRKDSFLPLPPSLPLKPPSLLFVSIAASFRENVDPATDPSRKLSRPLCLCLTHLRSLTNMHRGPLMYLLCDLQSLCVFSSLCLCAQNLHYSLISLFLQIPPVSPAVYLH